MSLASAYAATQATAASGQVTADAAAPTPFVGPNGRAEVTPTGGLRIIPSNPGVANVEIPAAGALALRDWLTATYG